MCSCCLAINSSRAAKTISTIIDAEFVCRVTDRLGLLVPGSPISPKMVNERSTRIIAVSNVLGRLGEEMLVVLEYHLKRHYALSLTSEDSTFSIDKLHDALEKLMGESAAGILTDEIHKEIDRLSKEQFH